MRISILPSAVEDLAAGHQFYEQRETGLGAYFLDSLNADIDSLQIFGGIHAIHFGRYHRLLAKRFPFAVYYTVQHEMVFVRAVLDCRRDPKWIRRHLGESGDAGVKPTTTS